MSVATGLLTQMVAEPGREADVERLLASSLEWVETEPRTAAWFALHFGHSAYGIVDLFPDERARDDHLEGPVAKMIASRAGDLLVDPPRIRSFDIISYKLPPGSTMATGRARVTKGALLELPPRRGKAGALAHFLEDARSMVEGEYDTKAWFAFRLDDGDEAIFDVFPGAGARMAHFAGPVPRALMWRGPLLLGGLPHLQLASVVAAKLPE